MVNLKVDVRTNSGNDVSATGCFGDMMFRRQDVSATGCFGDILSVDVFVLRRRPPTSHVVTSIGLLEILAIQVLRMLDLFSTWSTVMVCGWGILTCQKSFTYPGWVLVMSTCTRKSHSDHFIAIAFIISARTILWVVE